ncbi:V-type ATP synthase subunit F [Vulcanisaeta thermophila]|uniref:V-type ATP synthase subunit F n=1 Tax=Vulcanisaeta thermophila TaxID=867917 RepID=UPI001EE16844|nr:V-type ATP synthase subunit F [Vulcanisaeta thermophila]
MRAIVIGDEHTVYALRMMGFEGRVLGKNEDLIRVIRELSLEEDVGVIMVTNELTAKFRDEFNKLRMKMRKPLLIEIPTLREVKREEINYLAILRSTLGI